MNIHWYGTDWTLIKALVSIEIWHCDSRVSTFNRENNDQQICSVMQYGSVSPARYRMRLWIGCMRDEGRENTGYSSIFIFGRTGVFWTDGRRPGHLIVEGWMCGRRKDSEQKSKVCVRRKRWDSRFRVEERTMRPRVDEETAIRIGKLNYNRVVRLV